MTKEIIATDQAPEAIGTYSQAAKSGQLVFISGQIPLNPATMEMVSGDFTEQAHQVFKNLTAVANAANSSLTSALKFTVYLTDLDNFQLLNEVMATYVSEPYPARAAVEVSALPKGALIEIDAILTAH
ncbi:MAG: RidA family protein [Pseudomonadales bacterium]|nr:RidA family protein [Pseudomonadales bacterium]